MRDLVACSGLVLIVGGMLVRDIVRAYRAAPRVCLSRRMRRIIREYTHA